jgi:diguanylate cyclase (GGDEF)-like protein
MVAILALHALTVFVFSAHAMALSYLFTLFVSLIAMAACFRKRQTVGSPGRWKWTALCIGLFLWEAAIAIAAWEDLLRKNFRLVDEFSGFAYFLFGVPLLLAICASPNDEQIPAIVWIDSIMAVAIGILAYREIFAFIPGINKPEQLATVSRIAHVYDAENGLLALLASIRLLATEPNEERMFYRILCCFLWTYCIVTAFYNHLAVLRWQWGMGHSIDSVIDVEFLLLAWIALYGCGDLTQSRYVSRTLMVIIQPGISFSLPLVLVILGILAMRHSPGLGIASVVSSLTGYGLRATLSQATLLEAEGKLLESQRVLEEAAMIDSLTGVANRRAFDISLEQEWRRALRKNEGIAILLLDVDHFKNMNDTYGHPQGDECLRAVAAALRGCLSRSGDFLARYGGEEFACILATTNAEGALKVADQMCAAVAALQIEHRKSEHGIVTVSAGAAMCGRCSELQPAVLIENADRALYGAKRKGRNCAELVLSKPNLAEPVDHT